jgi:hypothetical protein
MKTPVNVAITGAAGQIVISDSDGLSADSGLTFVGETLTIGEAVIWQNGGVEITTIAQAAADTDGIDIKITSGDANGEADGGLIRIAGGTSTGKSGYGGGVLLEGGDPIAGEYSSGGNIDLDAGQGVQYGGVVTLQAGGGQYGGNAFVLAGAGSDYDGGYVTISGGTSASANGGDVRIVVGSGNGGPGDLVIANANVANDTTACVLTPASGPAGAQTDVQEWLRVKIGGAVRFIPMW